MKIKCGLILVFCFPCVLLILSSASSQTSDVETRSTKKRPTVLRNALGRGDDAYGVLNKGEIINVMGNYGTISDSYLQNVIYNFTWPKSQGAETSRAGSEDATDDFSFVFATTSVKNVQGTGAVTDGYTHFDREDWRGVDGAAGHYHAAVDQQGDNLLAPDGTPMLATSDLPESWPAGWMDDDDVWPGIWHPGPTGPFASLSPEEKAMVDSLAGWYDAKFDVWRFWPGKFRIDVKTGKQVPGEFAADRHVWCIMDDEDNLQAPEVGIVVEMEGMCYGRPFAEDFQFYDFTIRNTSSTRLDSCWWGYYIDPKFGDVNEEELYTYNSGINPKGKDNVFINYDPDGQTATGRWREIGVFGMAVLRTPKDLGVTDAHFNPEGGANPTSDWELWAQITGNPNDPFAPQPVGNFFHGPDPHFDDFSLTRGHPQDYGYMVMSGPFTLEPGEKVKATIVVSAGADRFELLSDPSDLERGDFASNIEIAEDMFRVNFQGPSGPPAPTLFAVPGDEKVTLFWDDLPEKTADPFSGEFDFEGYKIYRSVDGGATWGEPITNAFGQTVGFVPIAQFDVKNNIQGIDPLNADNNLGSNTGIKHVFVDENVNNGVRYTYAITAYDRGNPARNLSSFEAARGTSEIERNVVNVTPRSDAIGFKDPLVDIDSQAKGNGVLAIEVVAPPEKTETYTVAFPDSPATVFDVIFNQTVLATYAINSEADDPLVNGIRFRLSGDVTSGDISGIADEFGRNVLGIVHPDTTSSWYVESASAIPGSQAPFEAKVANYEIRFTSDSTWAGKAGPDPQLAQIRVPFSVWNVSAEPPVQTNCLISTPDLKYDLGEALFIGSNPYTAQSAGDTISTNWRKDFAYRMIIRATGSNPQATLPMAGQSISLSTTRAFSTSDFFTVTINPPVISATRDELDVLLDGVRVVPNPYVVNAPWETEQNVRRLRFMFLPGQCDISIYTAVGELVAKLRHDDGTGDHDWNLLTQSGTEVAYGVYVWVIETLDSTGSQHRKMGKFMIIK
ncbi:MAG: hypothetical protein ACE5IR_06470 [bacterium]